MNLEIEKARQEDVRPIVNALNSALKYKQAHGDNAWGEDQFDDTEVGQMVDEGVLYAAHLDGEVVGSFKLVWSDEWLWGERPDDAGYLHRLAVNEGHHGKGVGSRLVDAAIEIVKGSGKRYIRLDCPADTSLSAYYESIGFKRVETKVLEATATKPEYHVALYEREV